MKKSIEEIKLSNKNSSFNKNLYIDQFKTTNINILLNRVKLEKKNDFKRNFFILSVLFFSITFLSVIVIL